MPLEKTRIDNLDYLRGICAFLIMIYHYSGFLNIELSSEDPLQRVGVYGVSIFYVLSGLTLFHVYSKKMKPSFLDVLDFALKRIFRIFPLLWIVTLLTIFIHAQLPSPYQLFLNFTGLFGFVKPYAYIGMGVWSIGNELVFYAFFPLFIYLSKRSKPSFFLLSLLVLSAYIVFAFGEISPSISLADQWRTYINPLNQIFLFLGGYLVGYLSKTKQSNQLSLFILIASVILFVTIPASGNSVVLVTKWHRIAFTLISIGLCFSLYRSNFRLPDYLKKPLSFLGEISYSIYLLHPIVYFMLLKIIPNGIILILISIFFSVLLSALSYYYFEKTFINFGKRLSVKFLKLS